MLFIPQTRDTCAREKWGITRLKIIMPIKKISNVGPQKALNVVAILLLPSHATFEKEKSKSKTDQKLLQLFCKPQKNTPMSD
jgi:hypothetical protein